MQHTTGVTHADVALYVRALDLAPLKGQIQSFLDGFDRLTAHVAFDKVYLETHRDMVIVDDDTLLVLKDIFLQRGLKVAAGITVTVDEMDDFRTYCYSNPDHRHIIRTLVEKTARLFDEILFDDFFFTNCKCNLCIAQKGELSWTAFRLAQMTQASIELVLNPARAVNPNVKVRIKYPNWYEHFQASGFNLKDQPALYDGIHTGTETRDPHLSNQHLQPYQSYLVHRYFENIKPGGNGGGWVDPFGASSIERYAQQIWMTLFSKAKEIVLFDYHALQNPIQDEMRGKWQDVGKIKGCQDAAIAEECKDAAPAMSFDHITAPYRDAAGRLNEHAQMIVLAGKALEMVSPVLRHLGMPKGIASYRPHHVCGEDFLHNYIGMLGIPMDLKPVFPVDADLVFLSESAAQDTQILQHMKTHLLAGKRLVITSGLVKALQEKGLDDIAELRVTDRKLAVDSFVVGWAPETFMPCQPILFPQIKAMTNDSWEEVSCIADWAGCPFITAVRYGDGKMHILTMPDNPSDLYNLPKEVLDKLRAVFASGAIPVSLEQTPAKVSLMVYDNDTFVLQSFLDVATDVTISISGNRPMLRELGMAHDDYELHYISQDQDVGECARFCVRLKAHAFRAFAWKT